ncbi:MAG: M1 family aminopeptidase [Bacteroidales bacterium]|jgi:ABC-2 type transport system permease protein|nr:M1 family aminopeptidase [Bacteroidales bacterium]
MFFRILSFELKYKFTRPAVYIYWIILFALTFLMVNAFSGLIDGVSVSIAGMGGKILTNSPFIIYTLTSGFGFMAMILLPALIGSSVYRDYETNAHAILFSYPISRFGYLGGRFLGGLIASIFVFSSIGFGIWMASLMPYLNQDFFGENVFMAYISPYLSNIIPNLFIVGIIIFTIAAVSRNLLATYLGCIALLVLYGVAGSLISDLDNITLASLIDPFGGTAFDTLTKYWTVTEKNEKIIPFTWLLLVNRLLWLSFAIAIFSFLLSKFKFAQSVFQLKFRKNSRLIFANINPVFKVFKLKLPKVNQQFTFKAKYRQLIRLIKFETINLIKNPYFLGILVTGILFVIMSASQIGKVYGTTTFPVTYQVMEVLGSAFKLFVFIIITFLSGEIVWNERGFKINEIVDSMPIPTWTIYTSKLAALFSVQFILMAIIMLIGIALQAIMGYFNFEIGLYIKGLFGIELLDFILLCFLAFIIHAVVNNKYLGHFILIIYYIFSMFMGSLGLEHNLYDFASDPGIWYSDMNGYGHFVFPFIIYKSYWFAFAIILAIFSNLLWVRGNENSLSKRISLLKQRMTLSTKVGLAVFLIIFIGLGSFIFYNTNVLNKYITSKEGMLQSVNYEKKYKKYKDHIQPRVIEMNMNVDIYPNRRDASFKGYYIITNKSNHPIDSVFVNYSSGVDFNKFEFEKAFEVVLDDKELEFRICKFDTPLMPGDSIKVNIELELISRGFRNSGSNTRLLGNGTFLSTGVLPSMGYNEGIELSNEKKRKKYDLPEKQLIAKMTDTNALQNTYISNDGDWIRFETIVSTVPDQIAIAPGYLEKEWEENGRKYFHYKMDTKILNFAAWLSADYEKLEDTWNGIDLAVYYHKGHEYNTDDMMKAMKMSLEYFSENFSPFQYKQLRIFEFPRFSSFAQSFPNMIPFSESIGFIANVEEEDFNYPFWVTSHEVAHQWWAHQVIGANVEGATVTSEILCQYSSLRVIEKEYGIEKVRDMIKYEMDRYLTGRSTELHYEPALLYMRPDQGYLHYNKGNIVMYALTDYIGEEKINSALKKFVADYAFQEAPFVTSLEFIEYIKEVTPDSLKYMIHDMFETITLYENKVSKVDYEELEDGKFKVNFSVECQKFRADSLGREEEIPINDWIDIAVFSKEVNDSTKKETEIFLQKFKIEENRDFEFIIDHKPSKVGIDPYFKLIDRHLDDNTKSTATISN